MSCPILSIPARARNYLIVLLLAVGGCTPISIYNVASIRNPVQAESQTLMIDRFEEEPLPEETRGDLVWRVRMRLLQKGVFHSVTLVTQAPRENADTLVLKGWITEFSAGNRFLQWIVGLGAGAAKVAGDFELTNAQQEVLLTFSASTSYAGGLGLGGGPLIDTSELLDRFAAAIAERIVRWGKGEAIED